ncbi:MAG TPA: PIG-L family deacetylase [Herbaspirillum sp.]|jgi:LmbE family N-acetylglucosaminyl deacetylase
MDFMKPHIQARQARQGPHERQDSPYPLGRDSAAREIVAGHGTPERSWRRHPTLNALPLIDAAELVPPHARAVVVAPHPDDEALGCGGLLAQLSQLKRDILLIAVSDGEKSHGPGSAWSAGLLAQTRPGETSAALARLGVRRISIVRARLPDGALGQPVPRRRLEALLRMHLRPADVLFASWRMDGHPDHEAVGTAAAAVAAEIECTLIEIPIWAWHWAKPGDARMAWQSARKLPLDRATMQKKKAALQCYRSQIEADLSTGKPAILPDEDLAHFYRPYEVFFL